MQLTLSLLMTTQDAFVDSVGQDQIAQNVQSDLESTPSTFSFFITTKLLPSCNGSVFLANEKLRFIYSVVKELKNINDEIV